MTTLEQFVSPALTRALGWTLLHSLWQGALVAAVLAGALLLLRRQRAEVRYVASAGALGIVVALAGITFGLYFNLGAGRGMLPGRGTAQAEQAVILKPTEHSVAIVAAASQYGAVASGQQAKINKHHYPARAANTPAAVLVRTTPPNWLAASLRYFDNHLPLLVVAWLLGLLAMSLRMLGGLLYVQRLRRYRVRPLSAAWQERLAVLAARSGLKRPVALLESALVQVPLVVGHIRPVILLPLGTVAGLSPAYLEVILAHELAHVLRRDYLVNLLQTVAEVLFFYHPAVWFLANCVRTERENCCDDAATALVGGDPLRLARALTALAEWSQSAVVPTAPRLALAAMNRPGALLLRVRRLVQRRPAAPTLAEGVLASALMLGGLALLGGSVVLAGPLAKATLPTVRHLVRPVLAAGLVSSSQTSQPTAAAPTIDTDTVRGTHPVDPGTVVITRDKKGRLTSLVVNGQPVAVPTDKPSKAERRADQQVTVVPVPEAARGRRIEYSTRVLDQAGRAADQEGRRLNDHAREMYRAGRELDKAGRKLDKMGREMDQAAQKLDRQNGTYTRESRRRAGEINSNVHIDIDDAVLNQLVTNALKLGNVGLNIGLQAASQGLDEARRALEATLRDPSLSDEARRATRDALTELRQEERQSQRQSPDRAQEARDRRQELQDRIRESQQELRDLEQDRADRGRDRADRNRDRNDALVDQMEKDGLLKDPNHYQVKLTARALVIDGREQPAKVFQKYLKLYENNTGRKLTGNNAMVITRNSDSSTIINNNGDGPPPPRPPRAPRAPLAPMASPLPPMAPPAPPAPPRPPRLDTDELRSELRKDGILGADEKNLQFQLNGSGLTVNGKKQPDEMAAKYRKLTGHDNG
jgi:bla regulator protein BlaR1